MATRLQRLRRTPVAETFPLAGPAFRRAAPGLLLVAVLVGLAARLHPAIRYAIWGSDSGEYFFLTNQLVDTGRILFDYDGWGIAYPYFPGMFVISGAVHSVLGVELGTAVQLSVPVLAALIPAFVGLLTYRVTSDPRAGVLAGFFIAVTAPVVLVTSHAMPGTLGHILLLLLLALLPDSYRDRRYWPLLVLTGIALVLTHHLTTYFAVGIVAFAGFLREFLARTTDRERLRVEVPLVALLVALASVWWLGVADPFREEIVGDALNANPILTALGFLLALAALPAAVIAKRRASAWTWAPRYPSFPRQALALGGGFFGVAALVVLFAFTKVPGTNIDVGAATILYVLPVLAWVAFVPLGIAVIRFHRQGTLVLGWLFAILASLAFSIITSSRVLFPFRHVDYMIEAMAPMVAVGMLMVYDQTVASRIPSERSGTRSALVAGLVALVVVSAATSLPPRETIGGFEEGITDAEYDAVLWAAARLPEGTPIAADHRISSLLWGHGELNATWDEAYVTYHSETPREAVEDLRALRNPVGGIQRTDYVFLSPPIEEGVTLVQWETSAPMSSTAVAKFDDPTWFEKVYDERDVRIYRVKWEAIDAAPGSTPAPP